MRIPRFSSHVTQHSILLVGSALHPCKTALARASRSASSISNSLPAPYSISPTRCITQATTGEIVLTSAANITSNCVDDADSFLSLIGLDFLVMFVFPKQAQAGLRRSFIFLGVTRNTTIGWRGSATFTAIFDQLTKS